MKIPDVQKLGAVDIEGGGRFLVLMVRENVAERLVAASPGARHDVPDLEVERLARAIQWHETPIGTLLPPIEPFYQRAIAYAATYTRLSESTERPST